ncbi:uncharacterized protein F4822DRAFT_440768 [Hypoxylon trugodes]|uniref:uncharacterized protein n=1 Tax=Hypoxylon trugodes TaxID=326681 RepID=UPI0021923DBF|nr:uncharacterized protein F4822DRAFT_440768 [Hypoxylon trugodes]KAI1383085.1 hypothetical protein F4822DRAFT_440768 [Hypoxylon trugodes]
MKFSVISSTLPMALSVSIPRAIPTGSWLISIESRYPLYLFDIIQANNGGFWYNKAPSSNCPDEVEGLDCSKYPGTQTAFIEGSVNGTVSLDVAVPGGQQVYVAPDGALSYTTPHSAALPEGAITTGFHRYRSETFGAPIMLSFAGKSIVACPSPESKDVYQIYVGGTNGQNCSWVNVYAETSSSDAYEFTA